MKTTNNKERNKKWPYIPDHPYRLLITGGSGSGKPNALLNLVSQQVDIDKLYLYTNDLSEPKHEFLIKRREDAGRKYLNDPNAFTEYSNTIDYVYENMMITNKKEKEKS